jgi:2-hydroxy-3-keto-5-methylthiopentenyl-1-phosphate phosphatase
MGESETMSDKWVVLCDFDGTITFDETFVDILKRFAPELSSELIPQMYDLTLTLKEGVRTIMESIESIHYPEMLEMISRAPIRKGFTEMLSMLSSSHIPFLIVTGGVAEFVEAALKEKPEGVLSIYGMTVDHSGPYLKVDSALQSDTELVSKVRLLDQFPGASSICIGDSVTDLNLALRCDFVISRGRLSEYLAERNVPFFPFEDFSDVSRILGNLICETSLELF